MKGMGSKKLIITYMRNIYIYNLCVYIMHTYKHTHIYVLYTCIFNTYPHIKEYATQIPMFINLPTHTLVAEFSPCIYYICENSYWTFSCRLTPTDCDTHVDTEVSALNHRIQEKEHICLLSSLLTPGPSMCFLPRVPVNQHTQRRQHWGFLGSRRQKVKQKAGIMTASI